MLNLSKIAIKKALGIEFPLLKRRLVEFENAEQMRKWFDWENEPKLEGLLLRDLVNDPLWESLWDPHSDAFANPLEVDFRLLHDAEVVCGLSANLAGASAHEIGKSFVDGACDTDHCAQSIYDETREALRVAAPGDYILWNEFNPALAPTHRFIHEVCLGLEELYRSRLLQGRIYRLHDSWVGFYRLPRSG